MAKENKNAVVYCRVASEPQVGGSSLTVQEEMCRRKAEMDGCRVIAVVSEAQSGVTANRDGFKRLMDYVKQNKAGAVYVSDIARLSRNSNDVFSFQGLLKKHGVSLVTVDDPERRFTETILALCADYESRRRSERVRAGIAARRKRLLGLAGVIE
jgi:DNA invertase Pin-like site-specific DNA recombinase